MGTRVCRVVVHCDNRDENSTAELSARCDILDLFVIQASSAQSVTQDFQFQIFFLHPPGAEVLTEDFRVDLGGGRVG